MHEETMRLKFVNEPWSRKYVQHYLKVQERIRALNKEAHAQGRGSVPFFGLQRYGPTDAGETNL